MTSRRNGPRKVEIHGHETDIFHVLDGTAEFVTGGTVVDLKAGANGVSSGKEITGGETHHLAKVWQTVPSQGLRRRRGVHRDLSCPSAGFPLHSAT